MMTPSDLPLRVREARNIFRPGTHGRTFFCLLLVLLFIAGSPVSAQKNKPKKEPDKSAAAGTEDDGSQHEQKVRDMVAFLEFVLNTLGSGQTAARDKEVLITESFAKIFRDARVQVEDDLDEGRHVITNKDVVAYLKDVDFFFQDVKFEFGIEKIESSKLPSGLLFYKVSLTRNLSGTTADGDAVNNTIPRFIEINFDPDTRDLKIVSMYTNEFDETEALTNWWNQLSHEWRSVFRNALSLADSVHLNDIKDMTAIAELDLSGNDYIQTIDPLAQLAGLRILNLRETHIDDLTPIRNLTELTAIDLSETSIRDLSPLKYATKIERLNISGTDVSDISVIQKMTALQTLEMRATPLEDFSPIAGLTSLELLDLQSTRITDLSSLAALEAIRELNLSRTATDDLGPLGDLKNLVVLNIDSTRVHDLRPLAGADSLKVLYANLTPVSDIRPLSTLVFLERIYCDQSKITSDQANSFMAARPAVLVVFDSKDLQAWWTALSEPWKHVLSGLARIGMSPSKEELAVVTNLDSVNFSGNALIRDLEPLRKLEKLRVIIADRTGLTSLSPLDTHRDIVYLDISRTMVADLSVLGKFTRLKVLKADSTGIESIEPLYNLSGLEMLYVDQTYVHDIIARELLEKNSDCLIVYKSNHLNRWWRSITGHWIKVFRTQMTDTAATRENLHRLVELETLQCRNAPVRDLSALSEFVRLKRLYVSGTAIKAIPELDNIRNVASLHLTNSPLRDIASLAGFEALEELDISNTAVDDLKAITGLQTLRTLNVAGTQVKKLTPLEYLDQLEFLDCSNTRVNNLTPVMYLPLKTLKCYNTKISGRKVGKFAELNPDCDVVFFR